jgi:hypothetical protein
VRRRRNTEEGDNMTMAERHLAESIVYLCTLLADRPRLIDRYIDYFGETPQRKRDAVTGSHANRLPRERREVPWLESSPRSTISRSRA